MDEAEREQVDPGRIDDTSADEPGDVEVLEAEPSDDGEPGASEPDDSEPGDGEVAYECSSWAGETRGLLASLLSTHEIVHAWQGTSLTVREADEERVDELINEVLASARPALDPAADKVVYDVGTWPASLQTSLAEGLTAADLPYEWDDQGDLVVYAEHEEEVEAILDELPDPTDEDLLDESDGLQLHELLDRLFLASSRLIKHPDDAAAVVSVDAAASGLESMSLPFGFDRRQWRALVGRAVALRQAIEAEPGDPEALDDEGFAVLATEVRDLVRQYV